MTLSFFNGKSPCPTQEELNAVLGEALEAWQRLVAFIEAQPGMNGIWDRGGVKYGWNRWYHLGSKAIANLYPQMGMLIAQVVLGAALVEQARSMPLGPGVIKVIEETKLYRDGMWLYIPVRTLEEAADVEALLRLKLPAKRKPKSD